MLVWGPWVFLASFLVWGGLRWWRFAAADETAHLRRRRDRVAGWGILIVIVKCVSGGHLWIGICYRCCCCRLLIYGGKDFGICSVCALGLYLLTLSGTGMGIVIVIVAVRSGDCHWICDGYCVFGRLLWTCRGRDVSDALTSALRL